MSNNKREFDRKRKKIIFKKMQESHFFNECRPGFKPFINDKSEAKDKILLFTDEEIKEGLRELSEGFAKARIRARQIQNETLMDDDVRNRLYR